MKLMLVGFNVISNFSWIPAFSKKFCNFFEPILSDMKKKSRVGSVGSRRVTSLSIGDKDHFSMGFEIEPRKKDNSVSKKFFL